PLRGAARPGEAGAFDPTSAPLRPGEARAFDPIAAPTPATAPVPSFRTPAGSLPPPTTTATPRYAPSGEVPRLAPPAPDPQPRKKRGVPWLAILVLLAAAAAAAVVYFVLPLVA